MDWHADLPTGSDLGLEQCERSVGNFRNLRVWQAARRLAVEVYLATSRFPSRERFGLQSQMRRAAISIAANIAEGAGRGGDRELARFLRYARGSVFELECQLAIARELGLLDADQAASLELDLAEVGRMLHGLLSHLART